MSDTKLRCALAYRLSDKAPVLLAKYDHASQYETHGGAGGELYGGKDKAYAEAVGKVIENDPPAGLTESGAIGGFKVVQSDQHQVVYGADADGICKFSSPSHNCCRCGGRVKFYPHMNCFCFLRLRSDYWFRLPVASRDSDVTGDIQELYGKIRSRSKDRKRRSVN
jgi:hypothetical protein